MTFHFYGELLQQKLGEFLVYIANHPDTTSAGEVYKGLGLSTSTGVNRKQILLEMGLIEEFGGSGNRKPLRITSKGREVLSQPMSLQKDGKQNNILPAENTSPRKPVVVKTEPLTPHEQGPRQPTNTSSVGKIRGGNSDCKHHWLVARPNGPTSEGICRKCGAQNTYPNVPDDLRYGYENPPLARTGARR